MDPLKSSSQVDLRKIQKVSNETSLQTYLPGFKEEDLWLFFIDPKHQALGSQIYDKGLSWRDNVVLLFNTGKYFRVTNIEPGYVEALKNAFLYILKQVQMENPFTIKEFIKSHDLSTQTLTGPRFAAGITITGLGYPLDKDVPFKSEISEQAKKFLEKNKIVSFSGPQDGFLAFYCQDAGKFDMKEFPMIKHFGKEAFHAGHFEHYGELLKNYSACNFIFPNHASPALESKNDQQSKRKMMVETLKKIFTDFELDMIKAQTNRDDKLLAIIKLCMKLEIGHFFADANLRTCGMLTFRWLLLEHGYPMSIFEPNIFDGYYTPEEIMEIYEKGTKDYEKILNNTYLDPNGFKPGAWENISQLQDPCKINDENYEKYIRANPEKVYRFLQNLMALYSNSHEITDEGETLDLKIVKIFLRIFPDSSERINKLYDLDIRFQLAAKRHNGYTEYVS